MDTNEELLEIITSFGDVAKYLIGGNGGCVDTGKEIGKGMYGKIYKVKLNDKFYALKQLEYELDAYENIGKTFDYIKKVTSNIKDHDLILLLNKKTFERDPTTFYIPKVNTLCKQSYEYQRFDNKKNVTINGYICNMDVYIEYLIGVLCSEFLKNGTSINFLNMFGFSTCINLKKLNFYFYMELIDSTLLDVLGCIDEFMIKGTLVQILHSIYMLQTLEINHNDLHASNIFLEYINDDTTFMNVKLKDIVYFHYNIGDVDLYIPALPYIVKIGDFGASNKYSYPAIAEYENLKYGKGATPDEDKIKEYKSSIPNWFNKSYDILTILFSLYKNIVIINNTKPKQFLIKILNYIYENHKGVDFSRPQAFRDMIRLNYIDSYHRPNIFTLDEDFPHINPKMLLENMNLFGEFRNKPNISSKYILTLGKSP